MCFLFEFKNLQRCCLHLCQVDEFDTFRVDLPRNDSSFLRKEIVSGGLGEPESLFWQENWGWRGTEVAEENRAM